MGSEGNKEQDAPDHVASQFPLLKCDQHAEASRQRDLARHPAWDYDYL
jgi:hypothetical protein